MPKVSPTSKPPKPSKSKDPKQSHLYTDDNPSTTIHGTGFKDINAAKHTLDLIAKRSPLYQWQTCNTMYHRAKTHPHKNQEMEKAMNVFRQWLDVTYPALKRSTRGFKPLLPKKVVERYLARMDSEGVDSRFAKLYAALEPRKRLANVLVNPASPQGPDWERTRTDTLDSLVPLEKEKAGFTDEELWQSENKVSRHHLQLIAWAWSPVSDKRLP